MLVLAIFYLMTSLCHRLGLRQAIAIAEAAVRKRLAELPPAMDEKRPVLVPRHVSAAALRPQSP